MHPKTMITCSLPWRWKLFWCNNTIIGIYLKKNTKYTLMWEIFPRRNFRESLFIRNIFYILWEFIFAKWSKTKISREFKFANWLKRTIMWGLIFANCLESNITLLWVLKVKCFKSKISTMSLKIVNTSEQEN